jgi:hypothetical protein
VRDWKNAVNIYVPYNIKVEVKEIKAQPKNVAMLPLKFPMDIISRGELNSFRYKIKQIKKTLFVIYNPKIVDVRNQLLKETKKQQQGVVIK